MGRELDWVGIVERMYQPELPESEWLAGIVEAVAATSDLGLGANAFTYSVDRERGMRIGALAASVRPHEYRSVMERLAREYRRPYVAGSYGSLVCATSWETPGFADSPNRRILNEVGVEDVLGANGLDTSGQCAFIGIPSASRITVDYPTRARWERIAVHLAASHRLRRRLRAEHPSGALPLGADAMISPDGRIEHADGDATSREARSALADGAKRIEHARGKQRRVDPDASIAEWRGLIAARWTLVETRVVGGRRYLLACNNESASPRIADLSNRERQVAALASMGFAHKLIAYHLGVAASTSRVLLGRALKKLGLATVADLCALFAGDVARGDAPPPSSSTPARARSG